MTRSQNLISESDINRCYQYIHYINEYCRNNDIKEFDKHLFITNPSRYSDYLNEIIDNIFKNDEVRKYNFISELRGSFKRLELNYKWLSSERRCYFAWFFIRTYPLEPYSGLSMERILCDKLASKSSYVFEFINLPSNKEEVIDLIQQFFNKSELYSERLKELKRRIPFLYAERSHTKHPFGKLNNDYDIEWTLEYIKNRFNEDTGISHFHIMSYFDKNLENKYDLILAAYYFFYVPNEDKRKIFCFEYKKAFSQKKYREKKDVSTINVQLKTSIKLKMDQLNYHYQYSQQRLLEMLINSHFNSIKDKLDK